MRIAQEDLLDMFGKSGGGGYIARKDDKKVVGSQRKQDNLRRCGSLLGKEPNSHRTRNFFQKPDFLSF